MYIYIYVYIYIYLCIYIYICMYVFYTQTSIYSIQFLVQSLPLLCVMVASSPHRPGPAPVWGVPAWGYPNNWMVFKGTSY